MEIKLCQVVEKMHANKALQKKYNSSLHSFQNSLFSIRFRCLQYPLNNYLFFVSDKFGLKYFAVDYNGHLNNIANVQIINNN